MPTSQPSPRFERLDALRGFAIVWMAVFHFCFDLASFRITQENFYTDLFWTTQRTVIVSLFLFCAGAGQAVALHLGQGWSRFWRRWVQVAACAVLVSAGSAFMFPKTWISFGVLHGMALMLVLVRASAGWGRGLRMAGGVAMALPLWVQHPAFDSRWTNWIGLVTHKPFTEDFVPVLPWIGVMWWGMASAQWLLQHRPQILSGSVPAAMRPLAMLGRWSLSFYMLHQPILIGTLMLWQRGA